MLARIYGSGFPIKLIVGGVHGREWKYTRLLTKRINEDIESYGTIVVVPRLSRDKIYISTLKEEFYESTAGRNLLNLINILKPHFYLELHAYGKKSFRRLTDPERKEKYGVPPFYKLKSMLLIGSVSDKLLKKVKLDFALALEVPMSKNFSDAFEDAYRVIEIICRARNKEEIIRSLVDYVGSKNFEEYAGKILCWLSSFSYR